MYLLELTQAKQSCQDCVRTAQALWSMHNNVGAFESLQQTTEKLSDVLIEVENVPEADLQNEIRSWAANLKMQAEQLRKTFSNELFEAELKQLLSGPRVHITETQNAISAGNLQKALDSIIAARNRYKELISQEHKSIMDNSMATAFLSALHVEISDLETKVAQLTKELTLKKLQQEVQDNIRLAEQSLQRSQKDQTISRMAIASDLVFSLNSQFPEAASFVSSANATIASLKEKCALQESEDKIKSLTRTAEAKLITATSMLQRSDSSGASEMLAQADESIQELSNPEFVNLPLVRQFFSTWYTKSAQVREKVQQTIAEAAAKTAISDVRTVLLRIQLNKDDSAKCLSYLTEIKVLCIL